MNLMMFCLVLEFVAFRVKDKSVQHFTVVSTKIDAAQRLRERGGGGGIPQGPPLGT